LWWIAAAALVLLVAVPVVSLAVRGTGAGGDAAGGVAVRSGGQEAGEAAGPTRLVEEDESLAAGAGHEAAEERDGMQESIKDGGDAAGQTARPNGPVPDVVGMGLTAVCEKLSAREYVGYVIRTVEDPNAGPGLVVEQRPLPRRKGYVGGSVDLTVSEPYPEDELRRLSGRRNPACLDATG
jgi:hypothetical protein